MTGGLPPLIDAATVHRMRDGSRLDPTVEHHDTLDSTNRLARDRGLEGAPEGLVVIAEAQTHGRGRGDNDWVSTRGLGLYLSILLRPPARLMDTPVFAVLGGVAAIESVRAITGCDAQLKWPNDVLVAGCKVGGVLAEATTPLGDANPVVVLGIGLNVSHAAADLPANTPIPAASLALAGWEKPDRTALAATLVGRLKHHYLALKNEGIEPLQAAVDALWAERGAWVGLDGGPPSDREGRAVRLDLAANQLILADENEREIAVPLASFVRLRRI